MEERAIKIVILGPEASGKTTISQQLAEHFRTIWLPEYGRQYIENLGRKYEYKDVVHIAQKQIELENEYIKKAKNILFVDADLINIKVWFEIVYGQKPQWFDQKMIENFAEFYLLCSPDLEWQSDSVRENGGEMRKFLFELYRSNLEYYKLNYEILSGIGNKRIENAVNIIKNFKINSI